MVSAIGGGRVNEMHQAVQGLISVYQDWVNDPRQPATPTRAFETALRHAVAVVCDGDIPGRCQDLWLQVSRLQEEWNQYARGARDGKSRPLPRFWSAFASVENALKRSAAVMPKRAEPVKTLIDQKVGYEQIAFHIYGYRGKGPFVNVAGQPDIDLIHKEANEPGSVIPADWIHPSQLELTSESVVHRSHQVDWVNSLDGEEVKPQNIDPATIDSLLREGQYPDVIAKVKAVSVEAVLAEAERLGIQPNVRPNFGGSDIAEELPSTETETATQPAVTDSIANIGAESLHVPAPIGNDSGDTINSRIIALASQNKGAAEIAAELGQTPQKVGAVLREHRKQLAGAPASA